MDEIKSWVVWLGASDTDYLLEWAEVDKLPELTLQDTQIYEYHQWRTPHCTLYSAFGAVSDLFNYEWTQKEIDEMIEESYNRWRTKWEWWFIKSAVDLVADYWNEHHSDLWKVVYYRVSLYDTELIDKILTKNYTLCSWYRGNQKYNNDRDDNWILNWTTFWNATYGHAVSWIGREGKRFIKDSYKGRNKNWRFTNIYEVENEPSKLVSGLCFYDSAYVYTKVDNLAEIKRLNEFKTTLEVAIQLNSKMRHQTNSVEFQDQLHKFNNLLRKKVQDCNTELKKYQ